MTQYTFPPMPVLLAPASSVRDLGYYKSPRRPAPITDVLDRIRRLAREHIEASYENLDQNHAFAANVLANLAVDLVAAYPE